MAPVALAPPASDEVDPARTAARQSPPTTSRRRIPIPVPPMPQSSLTLLLLGIHIKHASKRNELGPDPRHVALSDALLPNEATTQLHAYTRAGLFRAEIHSSAGLGTLAGPLPQAQG